MIKRFFSFRGDWWRALPRFLLIFLIVLCLGLGMWGYVIFARTPQFAKDWGESTPNLVYFTLQLFLGDSGPVSFGTAQMGAMPWQLNVARLLAPAAAVIGALIAMLSIFDEQIKRAVNRSQRGHVVVVGDTPTANVIEDALKLDGATVVRTNADDPEGLTNAGARGASAVYVCGDDSADPGANLRIAATIRDLPTFKQKRKIAVALSDPDLAPALLARHLSHPDPDLDLFYLTNLTAARLAAYVMEKPDVHRVWLLGSGRVRDEMICELAQEWSIRRRSTDSLDIVVCGEGATEAVERAAPRLSAKILTHLTLHAVANVADAEPADVVVICGKNDAESLELALSTPQAWAGGPDSLVVHVEHGAQAATLFGEQGVGLLDDIDGVLDVVSTGALVHRSHTGLLVHEPVVDRLAHAAHRTRVRHALDTDDPTFPAEYLAPWENLDPALQQAHKDQIAAIPPLLTALEHAGWKIVPFAASGGLGLPPETIETLASEVHRHTDTTGVAYEDLSNEQQEISRELVRDLPETLAQLGLGITQVHSSADLIAAATTAA